MGLSYPAGSLAVSQEITAEKYQDAYVYPMSREQSQRIKLKNIPKLVPKTTTVHMRSFSFYVPLTVLGS